MKKTIEFYINGKLHKSCSYNRWDSVHDAVIHSLIRKGFVCASVDRNRLKNPLPCSSDIYVNPSTYECAVIYTKIFTGYTDKNGYKIYDEDTLRTPFGFDGQVNQHFNSGKFYVRRYYENRWGWDDYDVEDFSQYVKVKDVAGDKKKYWEKIAK